jgi:small subunit ribosomal protein S27Ae
LVLRLRGGGKKRKKKTFSSPKRIPHKHKTVKLAVLKYYKVCAPASTRIACGALAYGVLARAQVDDNGKITRLRKECPHEECGSGVNMANHFDRYCKHGGHYHLDVGHHCGLLCLQTAAGAI